MLTDLELIDMLAGLVDGSNPLPPPHPQRLSFPTDEQALVQLAAMTAVLGEHLEPEEMRHLLFKQTAWCSKRGAITDKDIRDELERVWHPVELTLAKYPKWIKSRAGIAWTLRRYQEWEAANEKIARQLYEKPPRIGAVRLPNAAVLDLVELTNAAHIHNEGLILGHCMSWSLNLEALKKHGNPKPGTAGALECLTYAVKLRHGELRVFSVHDKRDLPSMTVAYNTTSKRVLAQGFREDPHNWSALKCGAVRAVAEIVTIEKVIAKRAFCLKYCPGKSWCKTQVKFELGR